MLVLRAVVLLLSKAVNIGYCVHKRPSNVMVLHPEEEEAQLQCSMTFLSQYERGYRITIVAKRRLRLRHNLMLSTLLMYFTTFHLHSVTV